MFKRVLAVVLVMVALQFPARAQIPGVDAWISGENQILYSILAQEIQQVSSLVDAVANLRTMVEGINDVLASARTAVRIAQSVRYIDPRQWAEDLRGQFLAEFPEANILYGEAHDLYGNLRSLEARDGSFWERTSAADYRMTELAFRSFQYGYRGTFYNLLGNGFKVPNPTYADYLAERYLLDAKESLSRVYHRSAWSVFMKELASLREDARANQNLESQLAGINAAANIETAQNVQDLYLFEKIDRAKDQNHRENFERLEGWMRRKLPQVLGPSGQDSSGLGR